MRVVVVLLAAAGFGAFWLFNTEALILLAADCVMGGCGVPPIWFAIAAAAMGLIAVWSWRRRPAPVKSRAKRAARTKPAVGAAKKPAKSKAKAQSAS